MQGAAGTTFSLAFGASSQSGDGSPVWAVQGNPPALVGLALPECIIQVFEQDPEPHLNCSAAWHHHAMRLGSSSGFESPATNKSLCPHRRRWSCRHLVSRSGCGAGGPTCTGRRRHLRRMILQVPLENQN